MNTNKTHNTGRAVLIGLLCTLVLLIAALVGAAIFGNKDQFDHAKELLPLLIGLTTPLMTAVIAFYLQKK